MTKGLITIKFNEDLAEACNVLLENNVSGLVVLDGHHRYKICKELGIKPKTAIRKFATKTDEIICVGESNLQGRQLSPIQQIEIAQKLEPHYKKTSRNTHENWKEGRPCGNISTG